MLNKERSVVFYSSSVICARANSQACITKLEKLTSFSVIAFSMRLIKSEGNLTDLTSDSFLSDFNWNIIFKIYL